MGFARRCYRKAEDELDMEISIIIQEFSRNCKRIEIADIQTFRGILRERLKSIILRFDGELKDVE